MSTNKTPGGLPYPNPDDPVRDGATRIRQLADALEVRGGGLRIEARWVIVHTNAAGGFAITWAKPFTNLLICSLTYLQADIARNLAIGWQQGQPGNTGGSGVATSVTPPYYPDSTDLGIGYIAIGWDDAL